jgi:hypothetical protein
MHWTYRLPIGRPSPVLDVTCKANPNQMNYDIRKRLPKPEETKQLLDVLKSRNLNFCDYEEIEKEINSYFNIIPLKICIILKGATLFRARRNINEKPFEHTDEIYIAPISRITEFGRANKPYQQIFYTGLDMKQAAFEVLQNYRHSYNPYHEHDSVTIGAYEVMEDIHLATLIHSSDVHKIRPEMKAHLEKEKEILDFSILGDDFTKSFELILEFFSDQFAKANISNKEYIYSVFYLNHVLNSNDFKPKELNFKFEGVNYPSVARKYQFDNQAMTLETANNKLRLKNIYHVICTGFNFETGNLTIGIIHDAKEFNTGNIIWNTNTYGY